MRIDHIGYAVRKIDKAQEAFERLGYQFGEITDDYDRNLRIAFGEKDGYRIEIIAPLDKSKESPVDIYLNKVGPVPYHICYRSDNFEGDMEELQGKGFRIVLTPKKAAALGGLRVTFMMSLTIGLIELIETTR